MKREVKILPLTLGEGRKATKVKEAECELAELLNAGWRIISAGGGSGILVWDVAGFVILEREITTPTR